MTKAKRAAAQEGASAFEVELIQRRASVLTDAPQDKDLRSRRCAKDRLPCLENLRLFWRFEPFREGFIFFSTTLCVLRLHDSQSVARIYCSSNHGDQKASLCAATRTFPQILSD